MIYLTREELLSLNQRVILLFGGRYAPETQNILNVGAFNYLLEFVEAQEIFGQSVHPSIFHVASEYCFHIINDHIFEDGCKRTAILSGLIFLQNNGIKINTTNDQIKSLALKIEDKTINKDAIIIWLQEHAEV